MLQMQGVRILTLGGELRSSLLRSVAKKKKKKNLGHLGFHLLASVTHAAVKMSVPGCLCTPVFYCPECIQGGEIPGSYGHSRHLTFEELLGCFPSLLPHLNVPTSPS
ncbi:unnamed protein product [Rangifer tarandus platyrhynchus]|uniref:Uncharacterized protein n=1 Tax=Rangifer tarandus platyrhynchus TaxID=3082113 RepID=A0AC59ZIU6_RANTA